MSPPRTPRLLVLVPAAGQGERFGGDVPKQLVPLGGRPLLAWTLERLLACSPDRVVVALPASLLEEGALPFELDPRVETVAGGATRRESVERCLEAVPGQETDRLMIHDAVRPAVAPEDLAATLRAADRADGAVLGRALTDTVKRLDGRRIVETVDRSSLFRAETPQVFTRRVLERAVARAPRGEEFTDEAAMVERLGDARLVAVEAAHPNPKLTRPADLPLLEALLVGIGA